MDQGQNPGYILLLNGILNLSTCVYVDGKPDLQHFEVIFTSYNKLNERLSIAN